MGSLSIRQRAQDRVENRIEVLAHVLGQETQHQVAGLLQQCVLAPIATLGLCVSEVQRAVHLNDQLRLGAEKIHLHLSPAVESAWQ